VKREVEIHASLTHNNVVRMVQAFEDATFAMLVIEWMPGGSLKRLLDCRALKSVPEVQVRIVVRQLLAALQYIHTRKIVHCDVKPENILLGTSAMDSLPVGGGGSAQPLSGGGSVSVSTIAPHTTVKLCDFGNARRSRDARYFKATGSVGLVPFSAMHGTMGYMAPEVLAQRHYSTPVDMWAAGVLTYTMLSGQPPFKPYHSCQAKNAQFEGPVWARLSLEARDFCRCLLQRRPNKRATAEQALQHAWLSAELE
jgi:serine/threonine protein kinase